MVRRCRSMTANLIAWAEILDALGWCVALRLAARPPFLGPAARRWFAERNVDVSRWKNLVEQWQADERVEVLTKGDDLRVWRSAGTGGSSGANPPAPLTRRETEILSWVQQGKTSPEIAIICGCALRTVENHLARLYRKLGVRRRAQLLFELPDTDRPDLS